MSKANSVVRLGLLGILSVTNQPCEAITEIRPSVRESSMTFDDSRTFAPRHTTDQYDSQSVDAMLIIHCHLFLSSVDFYWLLICLSF